MLRLHRVIVPRLARSCRTLARTEGLGFSQVYIQVLGFFELFDRPGRELTRSSFVRQSSSCCCCLLLLVSSFSWIDRASRESKRTTRSSIVSPSMRRIDDNNNAFATFDVFIEGCVYIFNSVKKKKERKISLLYSFSKERSRSLSLCVLLCLSRGGRTATDLRAL